MPPNDAASFNYNNEGVAFNPTNNSLFLGGYGFESSIGEVGIPSSIVNSTNINNLATASILQAPLELWPVNGQSLIPNVSGLVAGDSSGVCLGGLQVVNGQLIGTLWDYYDPDGSATVSHFRIDSPNNLATSTIEGMFTVGTNGLNGGFYDGYMGAIPAAWQSALGAPYLVGSVTQTTIERTSNGPGAFGFNPSTLSTATPTTTVPYLYYPSSYPLGGGYMSTNPLFNGNTNISGVFFAPGSSSVLFFGSVGTNTITYGTGSAANDTSRGGGKGPHSVNGDYAYQAWAYNANDFLAVEDGQMQPWQLQPYATWNLDFPQSVSQHNARRSGFRSLHKPIVRRGGWSRHGQWPCTYRWSRFSSSRSTRRRVDPGGGGIHNRGPSNRSTTTAFRGLPEPDTLRLSGPYRLLAKRIGGASERID